MSDASCTPISISEVLEDYDGAIRCATGWTAENRQAAMTSDDLTREEVHDRVAWLKAEARKGADALHARAASLAKPTQLTDAESAALARKRLDEGSA